MKLSSMDIACFKSIYQFISIREVLYIKPKRLTETPWDEEEEEEKVTTTTDYYYDNEIY